MNPSTAQARVIVDELTRCGLRHVVLCPGSRNAPLSIALHEANVAGRLRLHVRIDERSAAFLALGLARGQQPGSRPAFAAVVCTSGTAAANFHPAALEAHHGAVPLLLITADRPAELLGTGANQTIAQHGIYGAAAPVVDFPLAERRTGTNAIWRATVCRAVAMACTGPGPVQLNLPLREPLVPDGDPDWPEPLTGRASDAPWTDWPCAKPATAQGLPDLGPRPLLILGDGDPALLREAANTAALGGWPVIAEPTATAPALHGGVSLIVGGSLIMSTARLPERLRPSGIVVAGRPTLSRWVATLTRTTPVVHMVDMNPQWTDPAHAATSAATWLSPTDLAATKPAPGWLSDWRSADESAGRAVDKQLAEATWPTGPQLVREFVAAVPAQALLFLGSSNPIRLADLVGQLGADLRVCANRGVAGIDGSVSTAIGLTLGAGGRGYALLGDLTFLHDTNGLLLGNDEPRPDLTIVVLNDVGGGIFTLLEQGAPEHAASFERVFGTPHQVDLAALCAAHRVPHQLVRTVDELRTALHGGSGLRVVEVSVPRDNARAVHAALRAAVDEALTEIFG